MGDIPEKIHKEKIKPGSVAVPFLELPSKGCVNESHTFAKIIKCRDAQACFLEVELKLTN